MAKASVAQVTVSGLATNPNPNSLPAGSCAVAENVVSRRPGVLTPCPTSTALATIESINFTTGKGLWSDADNGVVAVLPQNVDPNQWIPGTDETQIGELVCYSVNQNDGATLQWELTQLPIGYDIDEEEPIYRATGYLPGLSHAAYNSFRTLFNEKWSQIVSTGDSTSFRWAGLWPPQINAFSIFASPGYLIDGNSARYQAHYSLESTNTDKPFIVIGPVSSSACALNTYTDPNAVLLEIAVRADEPFIFNDSAYKIYVNVYRSSQVAAETAQEIPFDGKLIFKREITVADQALGHLEIVDEVSDLARAHGVNLYTNTTEEGEYGNAYCPPVARDISVFRDTTFYANRESLPVLSEYIPGPFLYDLGTGLFSADDREKGIGYRDSGDNNTVTNASTALVIGTAANAVGIAVGQYLRVTVGGDSLETRVVAVAGVNVTMEDPWPYASSSAATVSTMDQCTIKVYYADGTDASYETIVCDVVPDLFPYLTMGPTPPGFRINAGGGFGYALPSYGVTVQILSTCHAIKRVKYFEVAFSNGQNYEPPYTGDYLTFTEPLTSLVDTRPNRLFFSKQSLPESVPLNNFIDIGAGTILKTWATQSALLCLCTDGLWRVTGDNPNWQVYQIDPTVTLLHPDCLNSLNNQVYGWVEDGLALIGEDGSQTISTDAVGADIREWATQIKNWGAPYFWGPCLMGDRFWNEVWLNVYRAHSAADEFTHTTTLVYNTDTKNFTRLQRPFFSALLYSPDANRMISQVLIPGEGFNDIALTVQSDFNDPAGDGWLPCTVWFNAIQTDDKGKLKQWMDVNYFVADVEAAPNLNDGQWGSYLKALFNARNEEIDPLADDFTVNIQSMTQVSRDVHFWVPRRTALSDQQQLGLRTFLERDDEINETNGFYFQLQGFTVRYRIASDTLKR